jgi:chromosomal replication initiator protein
MNHTCTSTDLWQNVKSDLQSLFPHDVYRTWFESLECVQENEAEIVVSAPNDFAVIWIQDNYQDLIRKKLQAIAGKSMELKFIVNQQSAGQDSENSMHNDASALDITSNTRYGSELAHTGVNRARFNATTKAPSASNNALSPKNTFENYVVGVGNQLAHAACVAVANTPAKAYNPLFLYGDTGLGKTHLMQAVAHQVLNTNPQARIAYVSTEKFTNEFIRAIQENTLVKFRQRYRNVDVLLVDDIHFLSGKERIQEEFFHTFNELYESQKQIVFSSDRPASEIAKLEVRLVSRFQWGLVTDIQAPDLETRVAILSKKAKAMQLDLSPTLVQFLAERVSRNVRRMEGALTRVAGYAALMNGTIDIPSVEKLLQDILQEEAQQQLSIDKIQLKVAEHYSLHVSEMVSKRRPANIAFPRQIAMYLSRMLTAYSLEAIGTAFGGRDHGTVIHACKTVENMMEQDETIKRTIEFLSKQLSSSRFLV